MNGEVVSFELGKPMSWAAFKAMPEHIQIEYIEKLVEDFSVGSTALAEMFGVTGTTCSKHVKGILSVELPKYSSAKQREVFINEFCRATPPVGGQASGEPAVAVSLPVVTAPKATTTTMMLTKTTLTFSGEYSAKLIADKLSALFDDGVNVTVTIDIQIAE